MLDHGASCRVTTARDPTGLKGVFGEKPEAVKTFATILLGFLGSGAGPGSWVGSRTAHRESSADMVRKPPVGASPWTKVSPHSLRNGHEASCFCVRKFNRLPQVLQVPILSTNQHGMFGPMSNWFCPNPPDDQSLEWLATTTIHQKVPRIMKV